MSDAILGTLRAAGVLFSNPPAGVPNNPGINFVDGVAVSTQDRAGNVSPIEGSTPTPGAPTLVTESRDLTDADHLDTLECGAAGITLNVPEGLLAGFNCAVMANGTTSVSRGGATLLNGAGTTLTRAAATNAMFAIVGRASAPNSYVVTGT